MDDLISRQAAIDAFWKLDVEIRPSAINAIIDMIMTLPSGQPAADVRENVRGEWLHISDGYCDFLKCSQCGKTTDSRSNFCPNCGADMRGEQDEDNVPDTNVGDIISRQAAIDLFDAPDADGMFTSCGYAMRELKKLPSAQQWIPVSAWLPEEEDVYLVYAPSYKGGSSSAKENHRGVMFSRYKSGKWSIEHGYYERPNCVRAWMPLPEPYKGEET